MVHTNKRAQRAKLLIESHRINYGAFRFRSHKFYKHSQNTCSEISHVMNYGQQSKEERTRGGKGVGARP